MFRAAQQHFNRLAAMMTEEELEAFAAEVVGELEKHAVFDYVSGAVAALRNAAAYSKAAIPAAWAEGKSILQNRAAWRRYEKARAHSLEQQALRRKAEAAHQSAEQILTNRARRNEQTRRLHNVANGIEQGRIRPSQFNQTKAQTNFIEHHRTHSSAQSKTNASQQTSSSKQSPSFGRQVKKGLMVGGIGLGSGFLLGNVVGNRRAKLQNQQAEFYGQEQ